MEDFSEFQEAVGDVKPLKVEKRVRLSKKQQDRIAIEQRRKAALEATERDPNHLTDNHVDMVKPQDLLSYKKDGVQEGVFRKFRLGKYELEARLDLHHRTVEQARQEVYRFVADAMKYDLRTVTILHGKGEKEPVPALLKSWVNKWLRELDDVLAFHSCQPQHGGYGAVYVMLRKSERKKQETRDKLRIK
ncbi:DNA endonuclease SmrA [Bermanella sp. R86510]|uniref:DNA endonuclease SmrA n=1 Tax=unclassified Bermanella TaxID=2627862 RepID=UPI0037C75D29